MATHLKVLESLFKCLQTKPAGDAEILFHRVRAIERVEDLSKLLTDTCGSDDREPGLAGSIVHSSISRASPQPGSDLNCAVTSETRFSPRPQLATRRQIPLVTEIAVPDRQLLIRATDAFFSSSLQLFHVFSREEIAQRLSVLDANMGPAPNMSNTAIACVAAVAAVGARCPQACFDEDLQQGLYDVARFYFDSAVEENPLDAIKCSVLLAMHNFMARSTLALLHVDCGLSIARRQGLYVQNPRDTTLTTRRWNEYRGAWRTLLCLSSWVPFMAGFDRDLDDPSASILLINLDLGPQENDTDVLQSEMIKISLLKAELLRFRLANPTIDLATLEAANHDLQQWYSQLPDIMRLHAVGQLDYHNDTQICICYIHLLHLDAIILLASRAILQFLHQHGFRDQGAVPWTLLDQALVTQVARGVLAASQSSRILALFQGAGVVRNLSWLITNQAYAACVMLLHCTAQKQLHQRSEAQWAEYLQQAETCLSVLEACGLTDPAAAQLWEQLNRIHGVISNLAPRISAQPNLGTPSLVWAENTHLLTVPHDAKRGELELPEQLLKLLSQPFDDVFDVYTVYPVDM